jgi:hypothetical protein
MKHKIEITIALVQETLVNKVPTLFEIDVEWKTTYITKDSEGWFDRRLHSIMSDLYGEMLKHIEPDCFETQFKVNLIDTILELKDDGIEFDLMTETYKFSIENITTYKGDVYDNYWTFLPQVSMIEIIEEEEKEKE